MSIPFTLPHFPGGLRKISARKRPERSRPVPLNCGSGKEWPFDAASRIRTSHRQGGIIPFLQGTRRPFQEIFRQPRFFGRLFLKKGAKRTCDSLTARAKDARQKISGMTNKGCGDGPRKTPIFENRIFHAAG